MVSVSSSLTAARRPSVQLISRLYSKRRSSYRAPVRARGPSGLPEHPDKAERETRRDQRRIAPGQAGRVPRARLPATADERGGEQRALVGTKRLAQRIRQSDRGAVAQRVLRDLHPETPFPDPCQRLWKGQRGQAHQNSSEVIEGRSVGQSVTPTAPLIRIIRIGHRIFRIFRTSTVRFVRIGTFSRTSPTAHGHGLTVGIQARRDPDVHWQALDLEPEPAGQRADHAT